MKRVIIILAVATLFAMNSNAQSRDTLFTQCISGADTVLKSSVSGVKWTSVGNVIDVCDSCDSVIVYPNSPTSLLIGTITVGSTTITYYIHVVNYSSIHILPVDTTGNCNVEFATDVSGSFLGRWSGLNGYTISGNHYLVNSGAGSGYIYAEANCGVKLDSAYYHDCSTDTIPTGINDITENNVSIYPNPFTDKFTITPQIPFQLFDMLGKLVYDTKDKEFPADLPKGCYILKSSAFNKIIVKQ